MTDITIGWYAQDRQAQWRPVRYNKRRWLMLRKVGGLYHWRIGRIGGSLYIAR